MAAQSDPPYLRIVAELRRRIADGELAPGDRVPSTRRIAEEWGVALATATKALTVLRQDGTVLAHPRVGTVVAPRDPEPRKALPVEPDLTRDRIVRAAVEIADAEGLTALSMRVVAARLGVSTMSPYRYVNSKDDLVLLMADAAFGELRPSCADENWRPRLEAGARTLWALHRRHPWLAHISSLTRPLPLPNLLAHAEWALSALDGQGLDPAMVLDLHVLLYSYVQGVAVNLEREAHAVASTGLSDEQWMELHGPALARIAASGRYPAFARLTAALNVSGGYDLELDELFEFGLTPLLDGVAVLIDKQTTRQSTSADRRTAKSPERH